MKTLVVSLLCLVGSFGAAGGQNRTSTKIYLYCNPSATLITTANPDQPIKINRCTLLETNLDSLGLNFLKDKQVYIHVEPGRTYYFESITNTHNSLTPIISACTEQEFWLNVYFSGIGTYRHYFLDRESGLKLLEEKSK